MSSGEKGWVVYHKFVEILVSKFWNLEVTLFTFQIKSSFFMQDGPD